MRFVAPAKPIKTQAIRFALLSGLSFVVNLSITAGLHEWAGLSSLLSVPIAMACVTAMNFAALRWFVFGHDGRSVWRQFAGFVGSIAGFRLLEFGAFALFHGVFGSPYLITYAAILVASLIGKFTLLRGTVFRTRRPAPAANPA